MERVTHLETEHLIPGRPDIWIFVLIEAVIFGSYFVAYMVYRIWNPALFLQSQEQMSQSFDAVNTVTLLLSSWRMARAAQCARENRYDAAQRLVFQTVFC